MTEAERIDIRTEIANAAGTSVGNLTKIRQIPEEAGEDMIRGLRAGEVSIHRAWVWRVQAKPRQTQMLHDWRGAKSIDKSIRRLFTLKKSKDRTSDQAAREMRKALIEFRETDLRPELALSVERLIRDIEFAVSVGQAVDVHD